MTSKGKSKLLKHGSGGIRTHAPEETGALNQRLRPLGHATEKSLSCNPDPAIQIKAFGLKQTRASFMSKLISLQTKVVQLREKCTTSVDGVRGLSSYLPYLVAGKTETSPLGHKITVPREMYLSCLRGGRIA
jgi:hypothetical protein